jgi:cytochrome c-type biogenesis protein CcmE
MAVAPKRALRLVVTLTVVLTAASAARLGGMDGHDAITPLPEHAHQRRTYALQGTVIAGSVRRSGSGVDFAVDDPALGASVPVRYSGVVPDPFAAGRAVLINVQATRSGAFIGEPGSLTTRWHPLPQVMAPSRHQTKA